MRILVAGTAVPVIPCRLDGAYGYTHQGSGFHVGKVRLRVGEQKVFESVPNQRDGWETVARQLEEVVGGL